MTNLRARWEAAECGSRVSAFARPGTDGNSLRTRLMFKALRSADAHCFLGECACGATPPAPIAIGIFDPLGHLRLVGEEPRGIQKKMTKRTSGEGEGGGKRRARHGVIRQEPTPRSKNKRVRVRLSGRAYI